MEKIEVKFCNECPLAEVSPKDRTVICRPTKKELTDELYAFEAPLPN